MAMNTTTENQVIFDFNNSSSLKNWYSVDDDVMGGRSNGNIKLSDEGHGLFEGKISLENNGGFSSVRYEFEQMAVSPADQIVFRIKGDSKKYQFRVKENSRTYYSYIFEFETTGDWEEILIPLKEMYPSFRGRKLDRPNFEHEQIEEITFLIGNKKEEQFKLLIDKIEIRSE